MLWVGGLTTLSLNVSAEIIQVSTEVNGNNVQIHIHHRWDENHVESEHVFLKKTDNTWSLIEETLQYGNRIDLEIPTKAQLSIDQLKLNFLINGDLCLSGSCDQLQLDYGGKCLVEEGKMLQLGSFFLNQSVLFENLGTIQIYQDWLCSVRTFKNGITLGTSFLTIAAAVADDPTSTRKAVLFKHRFIQILLRYFKAKRISQNEVYGFTDSACLRFMGHLALQNFIRQVV